MKKTTKLQKISKESYDYLECVKFIKYKYKITDDDFWSWKSDYIDGNGTYTSIGNDDVESLIEENNMEGAEFAKRMIDEFGDEQEYWVSW